MTRSTFNFEDLQPILFVEKTLYFRALAYKKDAGWNILSLRISNIHYPVKEPSSIIEYKNFAFIFGQATGREVYCWLTQESLKFKGRNYAFSKIREHVEASKYTSTVNASWFNVTRPFTSYEIRHFERTSMPSDFEPLVAEGTPSFPNLKSAVSHYFYGESNKRDYAIPESIEIFIVQRECWLGKIHLYPSSIKIEIKGTNVEGKRLEIRTGLLHFEKIITKRGIIKFAFPEGLPDSLWIMVSNGDQWLDYRELNLTSQYWMERKDVVNKTENNPTEIKGIIARGESETTEFKEKVSGDKESIKRLIKTIAAFANGNGGVLIVGVQDKTGKILGIQGDLDAEELRLSNIIRNDLTPQPDHKIETQKVDGADLMIITVKSGTTPPYGIYPKDPKYYVRRGATTFPATQEEIRSLVRRNLKPNEYTPYYYE